jgi:hypothetical protein
LTWALIAIMSSWCSPIFPRFLLSSGKHLRRDREPAASAPQRCFHRPLRHDAHHGAPGHKVFARNGRRR